MSEGVLFLPRPPIRQADAFNEAVAAGSVEADLEKRLIESGRILYLYQANR